MKDSRANLFVISAVPGRIRFKIFQLYKNPLLANSLNNAILNVKGVRKARVNINNKSFLVFYDQEIIKEEELVKFINDSLESYNRAINEKDEMMTCAAAGKVVSMRKYSQVSNYNLKKNIQVKKVSNITQLKKSDWYKNSIKDVKKLLKTGSKGISTNVAKELLMIHGYNEFEESQKESLLKKFIEQFEGFIMKILLGASALSIFLGQIGDAITILAIVIIEAILGVWQNYKAEKSLEALRKYSLSMAKVIRDGKMQIIPSRELVHGDIMLFESGDIIPADARIIECSNLMVNEASLTGESEAIEKTHKVKYTADVPLGDRKNMVHMGTNVVKGNGKAIVVETGMNTEIGKIAKMLDQSREELTPLQKDLEGLAKAITFVCIGISFSVILSGVIGGQPFLEILRTGVSLAIGAIPEGLTTVLAISLAFGVQRMAKKGVIVKKLPSVETLSCADVICTDKTGTLTTGQMTVTDLYTLNNYYKVGGDGNSFEGDIYFNKETIDVKNREDLKKLITIGGLCNNSSYNLKDDNSIELIGDPTESALLVLAEKAKFDLGHFNCYTRVKEYAFDSELKKMTVICKDDKNIYSINVKGAPDVILRKCNKILDGSEIREIREEDRRKIKDIIDNMTHDALRVIAFAYKEVETNPEDEEEIETDLIFAGLTGMIDPPRVGVRRAIKKCHKAGIKVIMITGDHKKTAIAIAEKLHLLDYGGKVLSGNELDSLNDTELLKAIDDVVIFARTSPHQKLRIVKALKEKGHVVAMTGDGVNDAPAIKESNIGIAMGKNGTDVTREAASIILTDDNFITIVNAIEEGRGISGNVKKFIRYVLSGNIGEVFAILVATLLRLPTPLIASQILMVNLITEGIPALALGVDPPHYDAMGESPRNSNKSIFDKILLEKIISRGCLMGLSALSLFIGTYLISGNLARARTLAYGSIVANQMFHVFDCREEVIGKNRYIIPSVVISSLVLLGSIYIPQLIRFFGTYPLGIVDWLTLLFMACFVGRLDYIKDRAVKLVKRQRNISLA